MNPGIEAMLLVRLVLLSTAASFRQKAGPIKAEKRIKQKREMQKVRND